MGGTAGSAAQGPCDIYEAGGTPCVAAHSTVRALYGAYSGNLYQVRRASDNTTKEVPLLAAGDVVDISVQDSFCNGTTCVISMIYDQSPKHNDLPIAPKSAFMPGAGLGSNAADGKTTVRGHTVHGIYVTGDPNFIANKKPSVAYRNNKTTGVASGTQAESMYMVFDGKRSSSNCCFDYGNAEVSGAAGANATMEALYWGSSTWYDSGGGAGPWVGGDYENGMYYGDKKNSKSNTSVTGMDFVTGVLKGYTEDRFVLKAGNAQSGKLETKWDGQRPAGYATKKLEGAIILGTGGDGSQGGTGTFYEGAMTIGVSSDAIDDAIHANIVAAGYRR
jgi:non-reducing end alpha-L-arabinofuranosidase